MKIVIHGTNGGYRIIYPKQQMAELFDARPDNPKQKAIGQQAYSIHFSKSNVIFSKYKIVRDYKANSRTGNIAFSVIISNDDKLVGKDVQTLLDELSEYFDKKHIKDNNLGDINENWDFVTEIETNYKNEKSSAEKDFSQYTKEASFIYYSTKEELQEYFDKEEKFYDYKQVFFVDEKLKGKDENPLNALRHSENDLTGKIDFSKNVHSAPTNNNNKPEYNYSGENKNHGILKNLHFIIVLVIIFSIFGAFAIYEYFRMNKFDEQVMLYVEGNTLFLDELENFEKDCKKESSIIFKEKCENILPKIGDAINKRKFINNINFTKLKELSYFPEQNAFEETIKKIDTTKYEDIKKRLVNVSSLTLTQIADSIDKINTVIKDSIRAIEKQQEEKNQATIVASSTPNKSSNNSNFTPLQNEIIEYLRGSELNEDKLKEYLKDPPSETLKKTINLHLEFWELDGNPGKTYKVLFDKFKKDSNFKHLKGSKLKIFLEKKSKEDNPSYKKQDKRGLKI